MEYPKFKVSVRCFTYNQSKYITDAMNGFCMQQTDFPFVCCIVDDASTDGEQDVIKGYLEEYFNLADANVAFKKETNYANITYAQHKVNKNCYFSILFLKKNLYKTPNGFDLKLRYLSEWRDNVEYRGFCEGDDYWTDPHKLQQQYDFLNNNPEYGMCYTNCDVLYQETGNVEKYVLSRDQKWHEFSLDKYIEQRAYVAPLTWFYRSKYEIAPQLNVRSMDGTFVLFANMLAVTNVKYLDISTGTYRVLKNSACHFTDINKAVLREKNILKVQKSLCDLYNLPSSIKDECEQIYYRRNLAFFVANNLREEINLASKYIKCKTVRDHILIFSSHFVILRNLILSIRNKRNHN